MSESLRISRDGRLLRLRLDRPAKRNALDSALCRALAAAFVEADGDRSTGAILLEAEGEVFCAGMDLEEALAPGAAERLAIHEELFTAGVRARKPIVAAVRGPALAGGTGLVANAHVVIAAQGATFGLTEIRIGMWPFVIFRAVAAAVGERRAVELSLTGRIFGTAEALAWGLVHQVVPPIELEDRAVSLARQLANSSAAAIHRGLDFVQQTRGISAAEAGEIARRLRAEQFASPDFAEGVRAFREKRKPDWPSIE
jgi:enoyl-CoA hydratase/carnithine racemase